MKRESQAERDALKADILKMMKKDAPQEDESDEEDPELAKSHFELVIGKCGSVDSVQTRTAFERWSTSATATTTLGLV